MTKFPKISIITIVYNGVQEIEATIKSILGQNYPELEYIIIDGASTDGTQKVIDQFLPQITYFESKKDNGISDAFNKGIRRATGDLIGLINAGDVLASKALIHVANAYNGLAENNESLVLHGNIQMGIPSGKVYYPFDLRTFSYQMAVWHPTSFLSRNIYETFQYQTSFRIAMDYDLFSRLYVHGVAFSHINETLVHMDMSGLSNKNALMGFREVFKASRQNLGVSILFSVTHFGLRVLLFYNIRIWKFLQSLI